MRKSCRFVRRLGFQGARGIHADECLSEYADEELFVFLEQKKKNFPVTAVLFPERREWMAGKSISPRRREGGMLETGRSASGEWFVREKRFFSFSANYSLFREIYLHHVTEKVLSCYLFPFLPLFVSLRFHDGAMGMAQEIFPCDGNTERPSTWRGKAEVILRGSPRPIFYTVRQVAPPGTGIWKPDCFVPFCPGCRIPARGRDWGLPA